MVVFRSFLARKGATRRPSPQDVAVVRAATPLSSSARRECLAKQDDE